MFFLSKKYFLSYINFYLLNKPYFCIVNQTFMNKKTYIGYQAEDYTTPYAKFFDDKMLPIPEHIKNALAQSPFPQGKIPSVWEAKNLIHEGYASVETGYSLEQNSEIRVACLTKMPNVTPAMWHWWFGWHGCQANRYKLWHPKAHKDAHWQDGRDDVAYIGRTSQIEEYIGRSLEKANIRFLSPIELGFSAEAVAQKEKYVMICARVGYRDYPLDFGYLVHQIRATENGAEMRSRFFFGGEHIAIRSDNFLAKGVSKMLQKIVKLPEQRAIDLLNHCGEEMNHLAKRLPAIYAEFGN
jgi:DAPG hydrolase PhiG domain